VAAPVGNEFWKQRSTHGRAPIFPTPDALWDAASQYFSWVEANPLYEAQAFAYQGVVTIEPIAKMRAMTVAGLCIFLDISQQAWGEYRQRNGYGDVTTRVDDIIRTQKFEGASAGLLNANIIARDLGLADRSEHTGKDGGAIETKETGSRDLAKAMAAILSKGMKVGSGN
jgi:hypothetical protein